MYQYNCLMLKFPMSGWKSWPKIIKPDHIYTNPEEEITYGIESDPHVTILYGVDPSVTPGQLIDRGELPSISDLKLYITGMSKSQNPDYDVLMFEINCDMLHTINNHLKSSFKCYNEFPTYNPHMTIAYLKPGLADNYIKKYNQQGSLEIYPTCYVYSMTNGRKFQFK